MQNFVTLEIPGYGDRELASQLVPPGEGKRDRSNLWVAIIGPVPFSSAR